jgi:hypothetical protein
MAQHWFGWAWHRGRWQRLVEGKDLEGCARRLSAAADRLGVPDKRTVMFTGAPPSFTPRLACPKKARGPAET